jgi:hypothetical protein
MTDKAVENRQRVLEIKRDYHLRIITHEEAVERLQPIIDDMNLTAARIAKKYGKKPVKFKFSSLMR